MFGSNFVIAKKCFFCFSYKYISVKFCNWREIKIKNWVLVYILIRLSKLGLPFEKSYFKPGTDCIQYNTYNKKNTPTVEFDKIPVKKQVGIFSDNNNAFLAKLRDKNCQSIHKFPKENVNEQCLII